ncbi:MAG: FlgD immunoglobulin-like domain containing protein [Chthoniobacterales bacterium]
MRLLLHLVFAGVFCLSLSDAGSAEEPGATPARNIRISFLPPPLEGTISLGIYDANGTLVRVLFREAELEAFTVGADALHTTWDGKDDAGAMLPPGKYSARGFVVADLKVEDVPGQTTEPMPPVESVKARLVANPLNSDQKSTVDLSAGYDEDASFLETADGLPLYTVDEMPGITRVTLAQRPDKSLDFFEDDGDSVAQFHISGVSKMMAFDCGDFELK